MEVIPQCAAQFSGESRSEAASSPVFAHPAILLTLVMTQNQPQGTPLPGRPGVFVAGAPLPGPSAVYEGLRAQRQELGTQLAQLDGTRMEITSQLNDLPPGGTGRKALETRLTDIDGRIATVDKMLATNEAQLAQASAVPGAVVEPPRIIRQGPPEEAIVLGGMFMLTVLLPISIAFARRIWRKSAAAASSFPREIADKLNRMEQALEATSVEVERIGEGQRFLTRLLTEAEGARGLRAGESHLIERKSSAPPEPSR